MVGMGPQWSTRVQNGLNGSGMVCGPMPTNADQCYSSADCFKFGGSGAERVSHPHQIHGLPMSNNVTPLLAICTENKVEHEMVMCNIMEGCVPVSPLCVSLAVQLDLVLRASELAWW